ncbi:MAG: hypothetical protein JKX92_10945 [Porticoccaceae bacterium]|nr:hypothetical protein [Porticoccaceae bacterium]
MSQEDDKQKLLSELLLNCNFNVSDRSTLEKLTVLELEVMQTRFGKFFIGCSSLEEMKKKQRESDVESLRKLEKEALRKL